MKLLKFNQVTGSITGSTNQPIFINPAQVIYVDQGGEIATHSVIHLSNGKEYVVTGSLVETVTTFESIK